MAQGSYARRRAFAEVVQSKMSDDMCAFAELEREIAAFRRLCADVRNEFRSIADGES